MDTNGHEYHLFMKQCHSSCIFSCISCFSWFKCFIYSCPFVSISGSNVLFRVFRAFRGLNDFYYSCPFVVQMFFRVFRAFRSLK